MTSYPPRHLRPEERDLWEQVRKSATPLRKPIKPATPKTMKAVDHPKATRIVSPFHIGERSKTPVFTGLPRKLETTVSMDAKHYGRMKKGKLVPEARIDLHGMTLAEAHPALISFIIQAHQRSKRLVLVITGKGKATQNGEFHNNNIGILKRQVPHWLADYPLAPLVLQITQAHGRHGGGGALYVYLRRVR